MRRFIIFFSLFLLLISISSFSYGVTNVEDITVDTSYYQQFNSNYPSLVNIYEQLNGLTINGLTVDSSVISSLDNVFLYTNSSNELFIALSSEPFYTDNRGYRNNGFFTYNGNSYYLLLHLFGSQQLYISKEGSYNSIGFSATNISCNYLYSDNSFSSLYNGQYLTNFVNGSSEDVSIYNNSFNYEGEEEGGEGDNSFFDNFFDNLIHIVVPSSEQWQDVQDSFQDNILDKFHITSMSFNDNLTYDWGVITTLKSSAPIISFGSWGEIDLSSINELLNTPISFGQVVTQFGQWEPQRTNIPTERCYNA